MTRAKTFEEADRLGRILSDAVTKSLGRAEYSRDWPIRSAGALLDLPARIPPDVATAERLMNESRQRLDDLRARRVPATEVRTAECDWFGAEETFAVAKAAVEGRIHAVLAESLPAEIQVLRIGRAAIVAWPGEFFVEFALEVKRQFPDAAVITCANGELQGYIVTQAAVDQRRYEAGNALLQSPEAGDRVVARTLELLGELFPKG